VRDTGLTAADAWALADDRSTWRALRPTAGYAQQWVSEWVSTLWVRRHGRVNTCAGCLPKVTGVQLRKENFWQGTRQPTLVRVWPVYGLLITIGGVGYISNDFSQTVHLYGEGNLDNSLRTSPEDGKHTINNRKNPYPVYRYYTE